GVVARDANYAPAWALLSQAYSLRAYFDPVSIGNGSPAELRRLIEATIPKAEVAARRALALDDNLADGYSSLALVLRVRGKLVESEELYQKALAIDPGNSDALHFHARLLSDVGRVKEALAIRMRLRAIEPFVPIFNGITGQLLWLEGQNDAAIEMMN